jgi:hypothetical protein
MQDSSEIGLPPPQQGHYHHHIRLLDQILYTSFYSDPHLTYAAPIPGRSRVFFVNSRVCICSSRRRKFRRGPRCELSLSNKLHGGAYALVWVDSAFLEAVAGFPRANPPLHKRFRAVDFFPPLAGSRLPYAPATLRGVYFRLAKWEAHFASRLRICKSPKATAVCRTRNRACSTRRIKRSKLRAPCRRLRMTSLTRNQSTSATSPRASAAHSEAITVIAAA